MNHAEKKGDVDVDRDRLPVPQRWLESPLPNCLYCGLVVIFTKGTFDLNVMSTAIDTDHQP
jgi:hypothetical protein